MPFIRMLLTEESTEFINELADEIEKTSPIHDFSMNMLKRIGAILLTFLGRFVIALLILFIGFRIVNHIVHLIRKGFNRANIDLTLQTFLVSFIKVGLKVLVIFAAIAELGVGTSSIVALVGSGGLAVVLSLKGSLANIAGGVVLLFVKPFEVGDYISVQDSEEEGTVKAIGILYTKLLTLNNHQVMIPNGKLSDATIENLTHSRERMEEIVVGIEYSEDIDRVREVLKSVIENEESYLPDRPMLIFVKSYEDSCINMAVRYWVLTPDYWPSRWRSLENIKKAFDANNITIPFNQVDVNFFPVDKTEEIQN